MAEDLGQEDIVGHVFGFELVARDGSVGRAEEARFFDPPSDAVDRDFEVERTGPAPGPRGGASRLSRRWTPSSSVKKVLLV